MKTAPFRMEIGTRQVPIGFVRNRKARRYILRLLPGGVARVTIPRGGSIEFAIAFARENTAWLQRQLLRTPPEWTDGKEILFRGIPQAIRVSKTDSAFRVTFFDFELQVASERNVRAAIEARLRQVATRELAARTIEIAAQHSFQIRAVRVGDQRTRWGSCSSRKTISLNWRLIQTPESVRDYIIIHELMHLREMNHSEKFWAYVAAACPDYLEAERWLKKNAGLLR